MSDYFGVGTFYLVMILVVQSIIGSYFSSKKIRYFHETGVAIVLGMIVSAVAYFGFNYQSSLSKSVFIYVFLPAIIFSEGFMMKKRHFFKNMSYILTYGLLGTVITFITMLLLVNTICNHDLIKIQVQSKNTEDGEYETTSVELGIKDLSLFSAALSSKDSFLASTMIDHHSYPILFHVIFGEGIINDATSLVLFDSFETLVDGDVKDLEWSIIPKILFIMFKSISISVLAGIVFGIGCTLILKHFKFLNKTVVHELLILFLSAYAAYCIVEAFHFSGVIALLFTGIIIGHYAFYNLSEKAKICSNVTFQTLSSGAENMLFTYLGFTTFSYYRNAWSFTLIGWVILILFIGRFISVFIMSAILRLFFKKGTFAMGLREQIVLQMTGISRGILGFILMDQVESEEYSEVLNSTMLGVLILTTLFFGLVNPKIIDITLPPASHGHGHDHGQEQHHKNEEEDHINHQNEHSDEQDVQQKQEDEVNRKRQITDALLHGEYDEKLFKSKWKYKLQRFNAKYIKPFLIRDYYDNFDEIVISKELFKEDKYEMMRPDGYTKCQNLIRQSVLNLKGEVSKSKIQKTSVDFERVHRNQTIKEQNEDEEEDKLNYDEDKYLDRIKQLGIIKHSINVEEDENK
ncbi:hypothetical protein ABPG74_000118 [Tetrahymena malaccensis]